MNQICQIKIWTRNPQHHCDPREGQWYIHIVRAQMQEPLHNLYGNQEYFVMFSYHYYPRFKEVERRAYWFHLVHLSVSPSLDGIVSTLYLPQYSSDAFYFHTSYQPTSGNVLCVMCFNNSTIWIFVDFFTSGCWTHPMTLTYDPWWPLSMAPSMILALHCVYFSPSGSYPKLLCSQPDLIDMIAEKQSEIH